MVTKALALNKLLIVVFILKLNPHLNGDARNGATPSPACANRYGQLFGFWTFFT
jgi:hypothetical protein